jgi:hypothetical protein
VLHARQVELCLRTKKELKELKELKKEKQKKRPKNRYSPNVNLILELI